MKRKAWVLVLFLFALLAVAMGPRARAAGFGPALSAAQGEPGGTVEVSFPYDGAYQDLAAFRLQVEYDDTVLEYLRPQYGEQLREGTYTTRAEPGLVQTVFTASSGQPPLAAGDTVTYRFRVREDAPVGETLLLASAFQLADGEPAPISGDVDAALSFQVPPPPSDDARLLSLAPDYGVLQPAFDPGRLSYTMTVPYEVESVTFTAQPAPGALCRVNRKNLGAGGSNTIFAITVTAEDGETKQVYQVTVHRQEKEEELLSGDARLLALTPSAGSLSPAFSPEVLGYSLTVPYQVEELTFAATAAEGATYRVNRKNLGAGGSDTPFTITVTAQDGETKQVYTVTVHRQEKEPAAAEETSSGGGRDASPTAAPTRTPRPTQAPASAPEEESSSAREDPAGETAANTGETLSLAAATQGTPPPAGGLTIVNGSPSLVPLALALLFFGLMWALSGPLSRWLARRFPKKENPPPPRDSGDGEDLL